MRVSCRGRQSRRGRTCGRRHRSAKLDGVGGACQKPAMSTFVKACAVADVVPGTGKTITLEGQELALFNVDGTFYAIDNTCPHRGGPLGEGELEGCVVTCPWHAWQFDLSTGESITDDMSVVRHETRIEGDDVLVALG